MAGQRQPIELIQAKGKKHLTKKEIETRKVTEVKAPNDNIEAPDYLPAALKDDFYKITTVLTELGIMSNLDCGAVARFLLNQAEYLQYTKLLFKELQVDKQKTDKDYDRIKMLASLKQKAYQQCRSSANDLGLSISSRCRLVAPEGKEIPPTPKNKFAKFLNQ